MVWRRQEVPREFSSFSSVNHSPEIHGDVGSPRKWQRAPSSLAVQTLIMWLFGGVSYLSGRNTGVQGVSVLVLVGQTWKRSVSQERG